MKANGKIEFFEGCISGSIVTEKKTDKPAFGWDTIFVVDGFGKTIASLSEFKHQLNFRREPYLLFSTKYLQD